MIPARVRPGEIAALVGRQAGQARFLRGARELLLEGGVRVELVACHDDFHGIGAGFGFPLRYKIEASDVPDFKSVVSVLADRTAADVANPGVVPVAVDFPQTSTIDLFLIADPATQRVIAQYRVNSDEAGAIVTLGEIDASAYPGLAQFFKLGAAAGVLSTNATSSPFGLAYDYFRIDPSVAPAPLPRGKVYLPLIRR